MEHDYDYPVTDDFNEEPTCVTSAVNNLVDEVYSLLHELEADGSSELVFQYASAIEAKAEAAIKLADEDS